MCIWIYFIKNNKLLGYYVTRSWSYWKAFYINTCSLNGIIISQQQQRRRRTNNYTYYIYILFASAAVVAKLFSCVWLLLSSLLFIISLYFLYWFDFHWDWYGCDSYGVMYILYNKLCKLLCLSVWNYFSAVSSYTSNLQSNEFVINDFCC